MKKAVLLSICLIFVSAGFLRGELLSRIGPVDLDAIDAIKGKWVMEDSRYTFEFTDSFACRIDGVKYYHYKRTQSSPAYPWVYSIVKSKKTGRRYFARGEYRKGRFIGSTSRIAIEDKDHFLVFYSQNAEKVYYKAFRFKPRKKKEKKTKINLKNTRK